MGSRAAESLFGLIVAIAIYMPLLPARADWPRCHFGREGDRCPATYLNAVTRQGNADLSVGRRCLTSWRHSWGQRDARRDIVQWLGRAVGTASGGVCIRIDDRVREIRATSLGGNCGYDHGRANPPGADAVLRRGGTSRAVLTGCHASLSDTHFGGIVLRFDDTYGIGDAYLTGYFYGVYDGFGAETVAPFGASVFALSEHDTYHYAIDIFTIDGARWQPGSSPGNDR